MKEYIPVYVGSVTKYVFVESPTITPHDIAIRAYEISEGVMIKETCFGLQVTGTPDEVFHRVIPEDAVLTLAGQDPDTMVTNLRSH